MTPEAPENAPGATLAVTLQQTTLERLREQVGNGEPQSRGPSKPVTGRVCTTFWRCLTESCRAWGIAYELPCPSTANRPAPDQRWYLLAGIDQLRRLLPSHLQQSQP